MGTRELGKKGNKIQLLEKGRGKTLKEQRVDISGMTKIKFR